MTDESIKELQEDIDYFLKEEEKRAELEEKEGKGEDINPFAALLGFEKKEKAKEKIEEKKIIEIKKDSYIEGLIRRAGELTAKERSFDLFDIYKKAHGMVSPGSSPDYDVEEKGGL